MIADQVLEASPYLGHPVIPLIVNYGMPQDLPGLLRRLAQGRHGYSAEHMQKLGAVETRIAFVVPLGGVNREGSDGGNQGDSSLTMSKSQYEHLMIYLARVDAKAPDVIADLINLRSAEEFNCTSCYAVGHHRDSCAYDCPQAIEQTIWMLGRQGQDKD